MSFSSDIQHWPTVEAFAVHLAAHTPPRWAKGITFHHTAIPTVAQWTGAASMRGLLRYYRDDLGWSAGPHLFIGPDGIWQLTPLDTPGIHAHEPPNSTMIAVEVVGNYTKRFWGEEPGGEAIKGLAFGVLTELARWLKLATPLTKAAMPGHNEVRIPKPSCPGLAVNTGQVRAEVTMRLTDTKPTHKPGLYRVLHNGTWVRRGPGRTYARATRPDNTLYEFARDGDFPADAVVRGKDGYDWLHHLSEIGFIRADQAERLGD